MIRPIDIRLNAAHPELPLLEAVTFTGSPSTVLIRGVPPNCGRWAITAVSVAATFPDGSTTTRAAVQSANGVWVATLPATATSGRTANGLRILADGIDENGAAVMGYILGVADFAVASLAVTPAPQPGETSWQMLYFDAAPSTLRKGDVTKVDGVLKFYNGSAWEPFAAPVTLDGTVTPTSANGVKSSGIWSAIWGTLSALPTGFSSLYDWVVDQLAGKVSKTGDTMTGGLTVPNFTVGSRKSGSTVGINSTAEGYYTEASGPCSHAEGTNTEASGDGSHAEGYNATAQNDVEHAQGRFNVSHKASTTFGDAGNTLSSIGFGTANNNRKNAVETMQDGKTYFYGLGGYDGTNPTSATDLAAVVNAKASRAASPTAGNLAALDANGNPTDAGWTAGELARYSLVTKTINNGAVSLDDRASNAVTISATLSPNTLTINFPTAPTGKLRDFAMRLNIAAGVTAPEIAWPQGVTLENNGGEVPEIADGGTGGSSTILYFSESENNGTTAKFTVKGETLTAIAQA